MPPSSTHALRERWTPRYVGLVVAPIAATLLVWSFYMSAQGLWPLFRTHGFMTITMVTGSFVAGVSSEGGGVRVRRGPVPATVAQGACRVVI